MNPQQQTSLTRGIVVAVIVAVCTGGAYFCTNFITDNPNIKLAMTALAMVLSTIGSLLGYGTADGRRAARNDVRKSDVGYNLIEKIRIR